MPKERLDHFIAEKRPGPETVYATLTDLIALQYEARGFSFLPKYAVQSVLSGRHRSRLRGRGLDFDEVRKYIPGDDIRNIDWKVTARVGITHTKEFTEEKERPVLIVVDQRSNMFFGSQRYLKSVIAAHIAALAAWRTLDVGDRVGGILFGDTGLDLIKPKRNRKTVQQFLSILSTYNQELRAGKQSSEENLLNKALHQAIQNSSHDYLVVLLSDLQGFDESSLKMMSQIRRNNDLIVGLVQDPAEQYLSEEAVTLGDGTFQTRVENGKRIRQRFQTTTQERTQAIRNGLTKYSIPTFELNTKEEAPVQLRELIRPQTR